MTRDNSFTAIPIRRMNNIHKGLLYAGSAVQKAITSNSTVKPRMQFNVPKLLLPKIIVPKVFGVTPTQPYIIPVQSYF